MKYRCKSDLRKLSDYLYLEKMLGQEFLKDKLIAVTEIYGSEKLIICNQIIMIRGNDGFVALFDTKSYISDRFSSTSEKVLKSKLVDSRKDFYEKVLCKVSKKFYAKVYQKLSDEVQNVLEYSSIFVGFCSRRRINFTTKSGLNIQCEFGFCGKDNLRVTYQDGFVADYDIRHYPKSAIEGLENFILQNEV